MTAVSGVASGWAAYFKGLLSNYGISMPQALNGIFNPEQAPISTFYLFWCLLW